MKSIIKIAVYLGVVLVLSSCHRVEKELFGECNNPPRFSTKILNFDASGGIDTITSNARFWGISRVAIDSWEWYNRLVCGEGSEMDEAGFGTLCWLQFAYRDSILLPFYPIDLSLVHRFEGEWFSFTIEDDEKSNKQLVFVIKPNDTGKNRKLLIDIFAHNCFLPHLVISQSAE